MISLQAKNIQEYLSSVASITALANVYALPPKAEGVDSYIYPVLLSDNVDTYGSKWILSREALVNLNVVCKKSLWAWEYEEGVLHEILSVVNDNLISKDCTYVDSLDGVSSFAFTLGATQQIWYVNKRATIIQSYFIKYKI